MPLTLAYLRTSVLSLCYDDTKLQALLDRVPTEGVVPVLLSLPRQDARRVCAGLLPRAGLVEWSAYSARRAKEYAAAYAADAAAADAYAAAADAAAADAADAAAAYAARAAAAAAAYAARAAVATAAAYAAAAAAADAYAAADHEIAIRDAVRLLGWAR